MALAMVLAWNTTLGRKSFEVYGENKIEVVKPKPKKIKKEKKIEVSKVEEIVNKVKRTGKDARK